jgi:hypothetical protein
MKMKLLNILNYIDFKENKANIIIKWIIGLSISAIAFSFILGQYKVKQINRLENIESLAKQSIENTEKLRTEINKGFYDINLKIDKVYVDGVDAFDKYRVFTNKQLELIIDYGSDNKNLLKEMIKQNNEIMGGVIERDLMLKKNDTINPQIGVKSKY